MSFDIKRLGLAILTVAFAQTTLAYDYCSQQNYLKNNMIDAGFFLTGNQQAILKSDKTLEKNKKVTREAMNERIAKAIQKAGAKLNGITKEELAKKIAQASIAVGVDFQQLSSMIRKESTFCTDRVNQSSGASGCTQFTTIALQELKDQFSDNKKVRSPGATAIMKGFVTQFFAGKPNREAAFYKWLGSSKANMQVALRGSSNYDIDILSGAMLFKIYLSKAGGNYYSALVQYNGDNTRVGKKKKTQYKYVYAGEIQASANLISNDEQGTCIEAVSTTNEMIEQTCDLFQEDQYRCFEDKDLSPPALPEQFV